jgi:LPXTG-motif cell wall-anchored protein
LTAEEKMIRRLLIVGAVVLTALAFAAPASAQYGGVGGITVTNGDGTSGASCNPGGPLSASAQGFDPGTTVTFTFESDPVVLGTAVADASGAASIQSTWPAAAADGAHSVVASGTGDGVPFSVSSSTTCGVGGSGGGALPRTGSDSAPLLQIAIALVAAGGILVLAARKRMASVNA